MDDLADRTMHALVAHLGRPATIRDIASHVQRVHGGGHYPNIHGQVTALADAGILHLPKVGRSRLPTFNWRNPATVDAITHLQLRLASDLRAWRPHHAPALTGLAQRMAELDRVRSVHLMRPRRNLKLNRLAPIILHTDHDAQEPDRDALQHLHEAVTAVADTHDIRIDPLPLTRPALIDLATGPRASPIPAALRDGITILGPHLLWHTLRPAFERTGGSLAPASEPDLRDLPTARLLGQAARFGYHEQGSSPQQGDVDLVDAAVAVALLATDDPRHQAAAALVLLAGDPHPDLLTHLANEHDVEPRLLGLLVALHERGHRDQVAPAMKRLTRAAVGIEPADDHTLTSILETHHGRR